MELEQCIKGFCFELQGAIGRDGGIDICLFLLLIPSVNGQHP